MAASTGEMPAPERESIHEALSGLIQDQLQAVRNQDLKTLLLAIQQVVVELKDGRGDACLVDVCFVLGVLMQVRLSLAG